MKIKTSFGLIMIIALLTGDDQLIEKRKLQMKLRHRQRYKDIQRYYKTE